MESSRLNGLLARIAGLPVAVVGDVFLDAYWHIDMRRAELSLETPHFTQPVSQERYAGGAAANTAACLAALGAQVRVFSAVGRDWRGSLLLEVLQKLGADTSGVVRVEGRPTPAYIKPLLAGMEAQQEGPRFDFLPTVAPDASAIDSMLTALETTVPELAAVLVVQQLRAGVVTAGAAKRLRAATLSHPEPVFCVDSRHGMAEFGGMVWKPNRREAAAMLGVAADTASPEWGERLLAQGAKAVLVTLGADGCLVCDATGTGALPAIAVAPPVEPVGAGDAFHAAATCAIAVGAGLAEAAELGALAAAVTVAKLGQTGTATADEIRAVGSGGT